jgi:hypothetical protein
LPPHVPTDAELDAEARVLEHWVPGDDDADPPEEGVVRFEMPPALRRVLDRVTPGTFIRIIYLGFKHTPSGRRYQAFDVWGGDGQMSRSSHWPVASS